MSCAILNGSGLLPSTTTTTTDDSTDLDVGNSPPRLVTTIQYLASNSTIVTYRIIHVCMFCFAHAYVATSFIRHICLNLRHLVVGPTRECVGANRKKISSLLARATVDIRHVNQRSGLASHSQCRLERLCNCP